MADAIGSAVTALSSGAGASSGGIGFGTLVLFAVIALVLILIIFIFAVLFTNPADISILLEEQTATGMKKIRIGGKYISEGIPAVDKIQLTTKKKDKIPDWREYMTIGEKGVPELRIFKDINGDFHPIKTYINEETGEVIEKVDGKNMKFWYANDTRARIEAFKKTNVFLDKVLPALIWFVIGMMFILSLVYSNKNISETNANSKQILQEDFQIRTAEYQVVNETTQVLKDLKPLLEKIAGVQSNARIQNS